MSSCKASVRSLKSVDKLAQAAAFGLAALALQGAAAGAPPGSATAFVPLIQVADPEIPEMSGLAASRRRPGLYWTVNDSGGTPTLYAFNRRGQVLSKVEVVGASNIDWEDLALFERDGRSWLAVGDIGDNLAWRDSVSVYLLPEPEPGDLQATFERRIDFRYPDGPRDAEALAVDVANQQLLILQKGPAPAGLYALSLWPAPGASVLTAERLADLQLRWPGTPAAVAPIAAPRGRVAATAMDLSRDGRWLLVSTYVHLFGFRREAGEDWPATLAREPQVWKLPRQRGFESMAIEADGRGVVVAPEGYPAPVFRARELLPP